MFIFCRLNGIYLNYIKKFHRVKKGKPFFIKIL